MYKWDAEDYRKSSSNQERWAKELMELLKLKGSEQVLDIGCGDGRITAKIAAKVPEGNVVGIDNSEDMIKLAQKTFSPEEYVNLKFRHIDARFLDFNNEFEVIFSNAALHWVKDQSSVLNGIQKALKTKGKIILQMAGKGNAQEIIDVLFELIKLEKWENYFHNLEFPYGFFNAEEYSAMLKNAGLKPINVQLIPKIMFHSNIDELKGWIRTTWLPYTHKVPQELQEEFITQIAMSYLEKHPPTSQKVEIKMVRLEVEAEKE
ncbi:class I SAM-dependent methyltransferase [Methanobacterium alcaliphilum]|uniref:class I SAM-dependent methyltransferase n=1 Tax=Methanobacterium alcaliphilum TaxID=392018 RepID=UPI00200B2A68|nr:class I SAM-dependent methyltransferase [Methanobacterium alcaliphilum]MCK9151897.1 class I SAM-dependent methyltransferase [Methanobacterium alcaliphilum]